MRYEMMKSTAWGIMTTLIVASTIVLGSRNLEHFDAALVGYTFAVLFATFGITYRYAMWLQRPPTAIYWRRGWQMFLKRGHRARNLRYLVDRLIKEMADDPLFHPEPMGSVSRAFPSSLYTFPAARLAMIAPIPEQSPLAE